MAVSRRLQRSTALTTLAATINIICVQVVMQHLHVPTLIASIIVYTYFSNTVTGTFCTGTRAVLCRVGQACNDFGSEDFDMAGRMMRIISPKQGAVIESKLNEFMIEWQIQKQGCKNCILKISIRSAKSERVQYVKNYVKYSLLRFLLIFMELLA